MRRLNESLRITGRRLMDFPSPHSLFTTVVIAWEDVVRRIRPVLRKALHNAEGQGVGT
jgi:hypothetical protein